MDEFHTDVKTNRPQNRLYVDKYDDDQVWISIHVHGGSAHTTLTFEQAQQLIEALQKITAGVQA